MYPGNASCKDIPAGKTKIFQFKQQEKNKSDTARLTPAANISETETEYFIIMGIPGLHREDFSIKIDKSVITIAAKKESPAFSCVNDRCEYDYTDWSRAFALPADADSLLASAEYQNGELIIHIPRSDAGENQVKATIYVY